MIDRLQRFLWASGPFFKGAIGAVIVLVLYLSGVWVYLRWQEFQIMRADIAFIHPQLEQARHPAPAVAPPK